MKKRLLSLLLILCLCAALLPVAVFAEDNTVKELTKNNIEQYEEIGRYVFPTGSYILTEDINLSRFIQIEGNVTLDLNGYCISQTDKTRYLDIEIEPGHHLTLTDSRPEAKHTPAVTVEGEEILGGMIYGFQHIPGQSAGTIIIKSNASFTMEGGSIVSCQSLDVGWKYDYLRAGGVYVAIDSTFNMTGGRIIGCSTGVSGGAVVVGGKFNMSGGSIENCSAGGNGGGVYAFSDANFNMTGGMIKNCTACYDGAGVYVENGVTATLVPENITGNTKKGSGEVDNIVGSYEEYIPPVEPIDPDYPLISILPALAKDLPFADVTSADWFYSDVKYAYETGLMTGTASDAFSPEAPVTRGMVMTILARREGIRTDRYTPWYAAGCEWAKANGISDGSNPEAPVTREQLAAMLYRYAALKGRDLTAGENLNFTDASDVSAYALPALQWATGEKILTGSNGALNPQAPATRAHLAAILHRYFG